MVALGCMAVAAPAWGQDAKAKAEAKKVEKEADAAFDKGEYAEALAKYERVSELTPLRLPVKLRAARCVEKLGRLLEAQKRYDDIATAPEAPGSTRADADAQEAAKNARGALQQRIPRAIVRFDGVGDPLQRVDMVLDGEPFPQTKVGTPHQVDPGEHTIEGSLQRGKALEREKASARFNAKEGETVEVPLRFGSKAKGKGYAEGDVSTPPPSGESSDYWAILKKGKSAQRTVGWVVVGVGGVVFLGGGATTLVALGVKSSLDDQCPERRCPPSAHGEVDTYDTLQTLTTVFYLGGAAGVATGIALLATSPRERTLGARAPAAPVSAAAEGVRVSPWVGLGSAGMRGSF
jgi:hypothetical protein